MKELGATCPEEKKKKGIMEGEILESGHL